ncbi:MAG: hypothetical protein ACI8PZ_004794 [Myxococcota bacterium]|jgi:hypothetical protein
MRWWPLLLLLGCAQVSWLSDTVGPGVRPDPSSTEAPSTEPASTPVGTAPTSTSTAGECDDGTPYSWENFANPVITTWCAPCHSASVEGVDRSGAPEGVTLDTRDDVLRWAGAVATSVQVGVQTMPPAGGMTALERDALVEWIACGAPAESTITQPEPGPCDLLLWSDAATACADGFNAVRGDLVVDADTDLSCLCAVDGDLQVGERSEVVAPHLEWVGGDLRVEGAAALATLELESLESIGGSLILTDAPALGTLDIEGVEAIGADVIVQGTELLEALYLSALVEVPGDVRIEANPMLRRVELPRVVVFGGDVHVIGNRRLVDLDNTQSALSIGGDLEVVDNDAMVAFNGFPRTTHIGGDLVFRGNRDLVELVGLHSLASLDGDFVVADHPQLELLLTALLLERVGGGIQVTDAPVLTTWEGNEFLTSIGEDAVLPDDAPLLVRNTGLVSLPAHDQVTSARAVHIEDNPALLTVDLFPVLETLDGGLEVSANASLYRVFGFFGLERLGGDLRIQDNAALTSVEGFGALRQVTGRLVVNDNSALLRLPRIDLVRELEGVDLRDLPSLIDLRGLGRLDQVNGFVQLARCHSITHLNHLRFITAIEGSLAVVENDGLVDVTGLHTIGSIGENLTIASNASLAQIDAEAAAEAIGEEAVGGRIDVTDNGE